MTKRSDKRIIPFCTIIFTALFAFVFLINKNNIDSADAADLSKFNPGNIISDYTMSNYNSMTEQEIQNFLTNKNSCSNRDYSYYEYLSNRNPGIAWHWKDGHFVCISEELFGDGMVIGEGKTAARIIYETAQEYRINPQVLLVLIQKESGLITDPIPNSYDYRTMTGFGCPDTAPCDSQYFGFKNQIRKAAWLFREVLDGGWTNYPLGENYVQYNPDRNCGGSIVNIENLATSSLYRYTPYQPNAAALAAGTGTAYCGAYGNRNFYAYFSDWFGDPTMGEAPKPIAGTPSTPSPAISTISPLNTYTIVSAADTDYAVDIYGGKNAGNGANIQMYKYHGLENQQFQFVYDEEKGFYEIVNPASGESLNATGAQVYNKTNVQLWNRDGTCASYWKIEQEKDGTYSIKSSCSDLSLDIYGGTVKDEQNIQLYSYHGGKNQSWILRAAPASPLQSILSSNTYVVTSVADEEYAIDIYGGKAEDGSNIQLYKIHGRENQQFKFIYNEEKGFYEIVNPVSNKALNAYGMQTENETNVQLWERDNTCASYWKIELNNEKDGTYIISSACSGLVMDIYGGKIENEQNIQLYERHGGQNQGWVLKSE